MKPKPPLLISACLMGVACRYDGESQALPELGRLMARWQLVPICPEQLGGMPTPRTPSERRDGRVLTKDGTDVTEAFARGAEQACRIAVLYQAKQALLKARSPSCGHGEIYDGSFTGRRIPGSGVTAEALTGLGVAVYTEAEVEKLLNHPDII